MVGFITGVGVNIILGQLGNFTGYEASGANRVLRTLNLGINLWKVDLPTLAVGALTLVLIVVLTKTRLRALGLVVAVVVGSAVAASVLACRPPDRHRGRRHDTAERTADDHRPADPRDTRVVGARRCTRVRRHGAGAGVSAAFPNPDGSPSSASRDFIAQGTGSILSGLFQGMPAGGSMSATALAVQAGARTRLALFIAGGVMACVILVAAGAVGYVAFPALAALLMVVGYSTIKPADVRSVIKSGPVQAAVVLVTFALTVLIPVPQAVLAGVALAIVLFVVEQSNRVVVKQLHLDEHGHIRESDPPDVVPPGQVILLQPFGSLFFASATAFNEALPAVTADTTHSVVILRLRGIDDLGVSITNVVVRLATDLAGADSKLLVNGGEQLRARLAKSGALDQIGVDNFYLGDAWHGRTLRKADVDGRRWIAEQTGANGE